MLDSSSTGVVLVDLIKLMQEQSFLLIISSLLMYCQPTFKCMCIFKNGDQSDWFAGE